MIYDSKNGFVLFKFFRNIYEGLKSYKDYTKNFALGCHVRSIKGLPKSPFDCHEIIAFYSIFFDGEENSGFEFLANSPFCRYHGTDWHT